MASTPSWPLRLVKMPSTWSRSISGKSVVRDCPTPKVYRAAEWLPGFLRFFALTPSAGLPLRMLLLL